MLLPHHLQKHTFNPDLGCGVGFAHFIWDHLGCPQGACNMSKMSKLVGLMTIVNCHERRWGKRCMLARMDTLGQRACFHDGLLYEKHITLQTCLCAHCIVWVEWNWQTPRVITLEKTKMQVLTLPSADISNTRGHTFNIFISLPSKICDFDKFFLFIHFTATSQSNF